LWSLARTVIRGSPDLSGVVGPIGIVGYVNDAARSGFGSIFLLAGFISINLAVINLLPIPALDGGRLLVLFLEVVLRRDAPRLAIQLLNALGVSLIILLMVAVSYHDIGRLLT
jgi:regulator of sigma E protease